MSKTVTINQDKLLMLKETVASDSNITSHNSYCSELTEAAPEVDEYEIGDEGSNPPVGGNFYHVNESTSFDSSIIENKYDDLFNKTTYDFQNFIKQCKEKYGVDGWYISSWMERVHPEIKIDPKDIKIYNALSKKLSDVTKLWNEEEIKDETTDTSNDMTEDYDIISLAIEQYGTTSNISQAGYILPDGRLLNFGRNGVREEDHRGIEGIYKKNNISIWDDEYRYNYVVDFMNHGAIRCCVNGGILDMTKEPTKEQYYTIKMFVRKAVDVDIDFTDNNGNTLHSVSYSDAKPQQVTADIYRYYNEGIKPLGNVQYEEKQFINKLTENFDFEVDSSEIDLSSFKKKHELVPNIWNHDGTLNSRVRLKLLDIADDFWEYVNLTWVKPSGIILTGSICNFNWSQYSDIDLHLIVDFDEIDEKTEFVKDYLDSKKNEWNNEHSGLQIMGYPVELYVQNLGEMPESNGIYDLEENDWVREPNPDDIKSIGLNKFSIKDKAAKIMTIIDDMYDALASTDDSHKIEKMGDDASYLWKKVKEMRKSSLEKNGESGSGNIVYKILRRTGYLDRLWKLSNVVYDKTNSITESKSEKKKYTVYINDKKDETFSDMNWKRKPKVGKGFYYGGAVFKIKKVTDDSIYAIEENRLNDKLLLKEYLDKDNNFPLYKYFKWAESASDKEKLEALMYDNAYASSEYIKNMAKQYDEFETYRMELVKNEDIVYDDDFINNVADTIIQLKLYNSYEYFFRNIVDYHEWPSWLEMDFIRIVKNEWCIHFTEYADDISKEGFTSGTEDLDRLAFTGTGQRKPSAGYDFAFLIDDKNVDYNNYGSKAVIFRTSGVLVRHYGDEQDQVVFWGPNVKSFIPVENDGDWVVYGQNGQTLFRGENPSDVAVWATNNLPQYRKQIMTGKNGYIPKMGRWNTETNKYERVPYPIYRNESVKKYITLLKENLINEEVVADGNSEHNPYKKRWEAERKALKDFICNFGKVMTSKENGKTYKVYYDKVLSQLIGYNYCICLQWDAVNLKPKSVLYIRALDKFTDRMFQANFDARGKDNMAGTYDDLSYQAQ